MDKNIKTLSMSGRIFQWLLFFGFLGYAMISQSAGNVAMNFKGTLVVPPPCTINGDKPIEVQFGMVETTKINGSSYKQITLPYSLSCTEATSTSLRLQIKGDTGYSVDYLQTSVPDLAISIKNMQTQTLIKPNAWVNFESTNPIKLVATPVKKSGAILGAGDFTATATMMVDYQ
ncbi:TPA: fimbrial protein [Enterobacter kobei]|uniref:fimbrial protein n=1 Tax=Enterobacter kobei TaxID=208224 RepID=UPI002B1A0617|nr:fimbrial protein [Enterobacter kobei]HCM9166467.1 fimbrial protein [Enterobacter kobei]HEP0934963.1 fimbrial protein [Enterobacter roggenkampii]